MNLLELVQDTIAKEKQALVFVNTKNSAEKQAEDLSKRFQSSEELQLLAKELKSVLSQPTKQCERLARCVEKGIAFHHAGLNQKQKELIEDNFRSGVVKVIACTPTLAAGVDLPAFRAIIKDVKRFGHRGMDFIPVLEYLQMAGRAGRPKFDTEGEAIILATSEDQCDEVVERYIYGVPEGIYSKLAAEPVLRTYVLSLLATGMFKKKSQLLDFFSKTFFASQFGDMEKIEGLILKVLDMLEDWEFLTSSKSQDDFVSGDEIENDITYKATLLGKRVSELYLDPYTASRLIEAMHKKRPKTTFSYLQIVSYTLEMRPLLRTRQKEFDAIQQKIMLNEEYLLFDEPSGFEDDYDEYMNSIKTAMFFEDWIEEKTEEYLLETYNVRPGEIKVKVDQAYWLLFSCMELGKILLLQDEVKDMVKVRERVKYGIKEELMPLIKIEQIGKVRARKLYNNGVKNVGDLKKAGIGNLKLLLGEKIGSTVWKKLNQD